MMLEPIAAALPLPLERLVRDGYLAVQTFFILSGFVLARSCTVARWNRASLARFGIARLARIYPVYLVSLAIVSPFILDVMQRPGRSLGEKSGLLAAYGLVLQGWTGSLKVGWNTPAWSLSCEFFFYLCFPLLFLWLKNTKRSQLAVAVALAMVTPIYLNHAHLPPYWKPLHHLADFVMGIAAAEIYGRMERFARLRGYWLYGPAALLGVAFMVYPEVLRGTLVDLNTVLRPLNAAALIGFGLGGGMAARALAHKAIEYLGKVSYSMYILHVPFLWWFNRFAGDRVREHHFDGVLLYLTVVLIASTAAYEWIETPANRWMRRKSSGGKRNQSLNRAESPARATDHGDYEIAAQPALS
jgi:peptidoglycan/LPS O-acetylase OafA/YrhL